MTTEINKDLEEAITHIAKVFTKEFEKPPTPTDIACLMLSKEISLLTLAIDRIEDALNSMVKPDIKTKH